MDKLEISPTAMLIPSGDRESPIPPQIDFNLLVETALSTSWEELQNFCTETGADIDLQPIPSRRHASHEQFIDTSELDSQATSPAFDLPEFLTENGSFAESAVEAISKETSKPKGIRVANFANDNAPITLLNDDIDKNTEVRDDRIFFYGDSSVVSNETIHDHEIIALDVDKGKTSLNENCHYIGVIRYNTASGTISERLNKMVEDKITTPNPIAEVRNKETADNYDGNIIVTYPDGRVLQYLPTVPNLTPGAWDGGVGHSVTSPTLVGHGLGHSVTSLSSLGHGLSHPVTSLPSLGHELGHPVTSLPSLGRELGHMVTSPSPLGHGLGHSVTSPPAVGRGLGHSVTSLPSLGRGLGHTVTPQITADQHHESRDCYEFPDVQSELMDYTDSSNDSRGRTYDTSSKDKTALLLRYRSTRTKLLNTLDEINLVILNKGTKDKHSFSKKDSFENSYDRAALLKALKTLHSYQTEATGYICSFKRGEISREQLTDNMKILKNKFSSHESRMKKNYESKCNKTLFSDLLGEFQRLRSTSRELGEFQRGVLEEFNSLERVAPLAKRMAFNMSISHVDTLDVDSW